MTDDPPTTLVVRLEETDEFFDQFHADVEGGERRRTAQTPAQSQCSRSGSTGGHLH